MMRRATRRKVNLTDPQKRALQAMIENGRMTVPAAYDIQYATIHSLVRRGLVEYRNEMATIPVWVITQIGIDAFHAGYFYGSSWYSADVAKAIPQ